MTQNAPSRRQRIWEAAQGLELRDDSVEGLERRSDQGYDVFPRTPAKKQLAFAY